MDPYSKEHLISFYNFHLKQFGDRPEALRWTPQGQLKRYARLAEIAPDLNNASILDYGCGTGDFYRFLKRRGSTCSTRASISTKTSSSSQRRNIPNARSTCWTAPEDQVEGFFDYIVICGVFNLRVPGVADDLKETLVTLFKHCNKGLALNALSSHTPIKDPELHYTSPEEMVKFTLENLSPYFALRHDRVQDDFTLYIYTALNPIEP